MKTNQLLIEAHVEKVTGLISSIIPASSRDEVRSKYIYSWTKREGSRRRIRRRLKKKSNGRLIKGMALPRRGLAYNDMLPVHNLWLQYMENVLSQYLDKDLPKVYDPGYENFRYVMSLKMILFDKIKNWKFQHYSNESRLQWS